MFVDLCLSTDLACFMHLVMVPEAVVLEEDAGKCFLIPFNYPVCVCVCVHVGVYVSMCNYASAYRPTYSNIPQATSMLLSVCAC
jgi:hypothetical protein